MDKPESFILVVVFVKICHFCNEQILIIVYIKMLYIYFLNCTFALNIFYLKLKQ